MHNWLRHRAWPVLYDTWAGYMKHDGLMLSAAMAYAAAFSLFPLCLVLMAVLGFVTRFSSQAQTEQQQLLATVSERVSPWLAQQLGGLLVGVQSRALFGGPLGVVTLIVGAIAVFVQLEAMFDRIWGTTTFASKGWLGPLWAVLYGRLEHFIMLLCAGGLLVAIFVADLILAGIRPHVEQWRAGPTAWHWGQIGLTVVCNSLLFGLIYKATAQGAGPLARGPGRRPAGGRDLGRRPASPHPAGDRQELRPTAWWARSWPL